MPKDKKTVEETVVEPLENETTLSEIVENVEDKKIPESKPKKKNKSIFAYVTAKMAYIRSDADDDSDIIGVVREGDAMLVADELDEFYYGTINTVLGYVSKNQMEIR